VLTNLHYQKQLPFYAVLWYASRKVVRAYPRASGRSTTAQPERTGW
jgi:hypothetical protein